MSAPPTAAGPPNPDPHQDRPAAGADAPSRTGRLLTLVRTLIDYGRHLAATLQQHTSATDLAEVTQHFGTIDIGEILARITRGLLRAAALEARLISRPVREPAAPATLTTPSPRQPRAAQPEDEAPPQANCASPVCAPPGTGGQVRRTNSASICHSAAWPECRKRREPT